MASSTIIKLRFATYDRFSQTRTFKTLKGARKWAHEKIGAHPEISVQFQYAVGKYGDAKIEIREGCTFAELFPSPESETEVTDGPRSTPTRATAAASVSPYEAWRTFDAGGRDLKALSVTMINALVAGCRTSNNEASVALLKACEAELALRKTEG